MLVLTILVVLVAVSTIASGASLRKNAAAANIETGAKTQAMTKQAHAMTKQAQAMPKQAQDYDYYIIFPQEQSGGPDYYLYPNRQFYIDWINRERLGDAYPWVLYQKK